MRFRLYDEWSSLDETKHQKKGTWKKNLKRDVNQYGLRY